MASPRVLQVILSLNPGGTERLVLELVRRLHADVPMLVCCLDEPGAWAGELQTRDIELVALRRGPGFRPELGRAIAAAGHRHRATLIHAHHYSPFVYSCLARMWHPGMRLVFTEHGRTSDAPPSAKRRTINWMLGRLPHRVFAVSEDLKVHLVAEGFARASVDVIYNGIDIGPLPTPALRAAKREALGLSESDLLIGTIGRLDPVKDLGTLITAVAQLPATVRKRLIIIGDGAERLRLERTAGELDDPSRVVFLGHRDDARDWLAACDVYVNSSVSEGVSLTILEAMAAGLPVIATRVGGTPEVVNESCGRLIPSRDPSALTAALVTLAQNADQRRTLGQLARQRVETRFTVDRMVDQYRAVYESSNDNRH
jgi:glycosyltransferase involved in cell wall biosynthesis